MEPVGYPSIILYVVLVIGISLAVIRPFWGFLFAIIIFSAANMDAATFTRTSALGPYFNLYDCLYIVAIISTIVNTIGRPIIFPKPVLLVLIVIFIGSSYAFFSYTIKYEVLREIRWALDLPISFLLAANMVYDRERAKYYLYAIIIGAFLGSVATLIEYKTLSIAAGSGDAIRYRHAEKGLGTYLLVAVIQYPFFRDRGWLIKLLWGCALFLFGLCILFGQWRAVYIGIAITIIFLPLFAGKPSIYRRSFSIASIGFPILLLICIGFFSIKPFSFFERLTMKYESDSSAIARVNEVKLELNEWYKGNWLFGRGIGFYIVLRKSDIKEAGMMGSEAIAIGHIGYVKYLSNVGLLGLFIYGVYIPISLFKRSKNLFLFNHYWAIVLIGMIGMVAVLMETIMASMSTSYLAGIKHNVGFLYGAVWSLNSREIAAKSALPWQK